MSAADGVISAGFSLGLTTHPCRAGTAEARPEEQGKQTSFPLLPRPIRVPVSWLWSALTLMLGSLAPSLSLVHRDPSPLPFLTGTAHPKSFEPFPPLPLTHVKGGLAQSQTLKRGSSASIHSGSQSGGSFSMASWNQTSRPCGEGTSISPYSPLDIPFPSQILSDASFSPSRCHPQTPLSLFDLMVWIATSSPSSLSSHLRTRRPSPSPTRAFHVLTSIMGTVERSVTGACWRTRQVETSCPPSFAMFRALSTMDLKSMCFVARRAVVAVTTTCSRGVDGTGAGIAVCQAGGREERGIRGGRGGRWGEGKRQRERERERRRGWGGGRERKMFIIYEGKRLVQDGARMLSGTSRRRLRYLLSLGPLGEGREGRRREEEKKTAGVGRRSWISKGEWEVRASGDQGEERDDVNEEHVTDKPLACCPGCGRRGPRRRILRRRQSAPLQCERRRAARGRVKGRPTGSHGKRRRSMTTKWEGSPFRPQGAGKGSSTPFPGHLHPETHHSRPHVSSPFDAVPPLPLYSQTSGRTPRSFPPQNHVIATCYFHM